MKSNKLQDAISMIDSDLVMNAESRRRKSHTYHLKWTMPVAAVLALVIGLTVFIGFGGNNSGVLYAYAVSLPEYPTMSQYPKNMLDTSYNDKYEAWRDSVDAQNEYRGAGVNLDSYIKNTVSEFLSVSSGENAVYSPLNIYMALAMLAETTDGTTRQQILDLLCAEDIDSLRTQAHAIWNANYRNDGLSSCTLASSVWIDDKLNYNSKITDLLSEYYYASSYYGDMSSKDYGEAYKQWLKEQTGGLLDNYITDSQFPPETIIALATTVYFQAQWSDKFKKSDTSEGVFHTETDDIACDFMHRTDQSKAYYYGEKFSAVCQELQGSGNMCFILPDEGVSVSELIKNEETLSFITSPKDEWNKCKYMKINMSLPKFDVSSNTDLTASIKRLGITDCFSMERADFSPLIENDNVFLSGINHGARVSVDEEGVTGSAYTEMFLAGGAMPLEDEIDFVLDRPFLFVITGTDSLPVFIGVVNNPV
ncbi:MAG: hypothetical protein IJC86_04170 [Clostridia bacterium]|nr:hypothetical protein [Clostridia bacterium]